VANSDHQHATPFDDDNQTEPLPEELRQVAQRYATLQVPHPTSEETNRLIARLQISTSQDLSPLPVRPPRRRRVSPFLEMLAAVLVVGVVVGSFLFVLASRLHQPPGSASKPTPTPATTPTVVGSLSSPTPTGPVNSLQTIHMIDATTGWASTNTSLLRTTNGWRTWRDVTPHKAALVAGGYFLSGEEAWIAESGQQPGAIVSHTTDGGQTWQSATLSANVPVDPARMSFINSQDGWIEGETGGATGNDFETIFRTTNGGKSWVAVASTGSDNTPATFPFFGHKSGLVFVNASTGWATSNGLYVTHNGGATWKQQPLPAQACCLLPTFFNAHDGILPGGSQLFVTHDGGTTWQSTSSLPASSSLVTFIDMQHGWVAVDNGTMLYRTSDGGAHWAKITPAIAASITSVVQLNFVSTEVGWALGYTSEPPNTLLFRTTDGGQTWTQVP
jgi:photosystem II stability/assembly factor-like uncharacterized protein